MSHQHEHHGQGHHPAPKPAWHKDWRTWTVIALMLAAMAVYVFSVDESVGPAATPTQTEEPAAM